MSVLKNHFYHRTIHKYTSAFGLIFNDIKVLRDDGKLVKVPLAYSGQDKNNAKLDQNEITENNVRFRQRVPRMGYLLTSINKDEARSTNRNYRIQKKVDKESFGNSVQYNRVPYIFGYRLDVKTKTMDDLLQIIEQIVVYFHSPIQITIKDNSDLDAETSIVVKLDSSDLTDQFEGEYDNSRELTASFNFTLDGYLYMPTETKPIIRNAIVNYNTIDGLGNIEVGGVTVEPD